MLLLLLHFNIWYRIGASQEELATAAAEGAAWVAFQRMAAWWLGEHANVASDEYAGISGITAADPEEHGLIKPGSGRVEIDTDNRALSAGEVCATTTSALVLCLDGCTAPTFVAPGTPLFWSGMQSLTANGVHVCRSLRCKPARTQP